MFCVLSVKERNKTLFEKIFGKILAPDFSVKTIPVYKGAPFFELDITTSKKEINWEDVVFSVGKCASRLILNNNMVIPENLNVGVFKSQILYNKMMKNTIINIFENNKSRMYALSIIDKSAENTEFTKQMSKYASSIFISTLNKEKYSDICEIITGDTGVCPVLTNDFNDAQVKINTDTLTMTIHKDNENMNVSKGVDFSVPDIYEKLLPDGTDKYDFFSALYELCGVFSLGECIFDTIIVNNEKIPIQNIHFS